MVFAARDLSKPNTDALAMEEHGNEMKVTKRGRKIDEGAGEGWWRRHLPTPPTLKQFLFKEGLSRDVLRINRDRGTIDLWISDLNEFSITHIKKYVYLFIL